MLKPSVRSADLVALAAVIGAGFLLSLFPIFDSDLFWHLRAGTEILDTQRIDRNDVFSFTAAGRPFNNHEWLAGVVIALVYRVGGFAGLTIAKAACIVLLLLALVWAARERRITGVAVAWALLYVIVLARYRFLTKPELATFLGIAVFDALAVRYLRQGRRWLLLLLPLLTCLWANLHIGVVMAFAVLGAHVVGSWRAVPASRGNPLHLAIATAASVLASLLNPYGLDVYEPVMKIYTAKAIMNVGVREWLPPNIAGFTPFFVLAPIALLLFVVAKRRSPADALLFLGGLALACRSQRHVALFAILSAPGLAHQLSVIGHSIAPRLRPRLPTFARLWNHTAAVAACLISTTMVWLVLSSATACRLHQDESRQFGRGIGLGPYSGPVASVECLEAHALTGPMYNSYELGGYLLWRSWPRLKVFLDGRHYVYEQLFEWTGGSDHPTLAEVVARYDIRLAVVSYIDRTVTEFSTAPQWRLVCFDDIAAVYVRADALRADVPSYQYLNPADLTLGWYTSLDSERQSKARIEAIAASQQCPDCARSWALRGALEQRTGVLEEAIRAYSHAVTLRPDQMMYRNNLGVALAEAGRDEDAAAAFAQASALEPNAFAPALNEALARTRLGELNRARRILRALAHSKHSSARVDLVLGLIEDDPTRAMRHLRAYLARTSLTADGRDEANTRLRQLEQGR